jgi:hypothetical protein
LAKKKGRDQGCQGQSQEIPILSMFDHSRTFSVVYELNRFIGIIKDFL